MRVEFEVVSHRSRWTFRCPVCSKPLVRIKKFWQTLNQFNVHKSGPLKGCRKDAAAILAECRREANKWQASDVYCAEHANRLGGSASERREHQ